MRRLLLIFFFTTLYLWATEIDLSFEKPYIYNKRLTQEKIDIPKSLVIPTIKGFKINRAEYKKYHNLNLAYLQDDGKKIQKIVEGEYWLVSQKRVNKKNRFLLTKDSLITLYKTSPNFKEIKFYKSRLDSEHKTIFHIDNNWGVMTIYPDSLNIEVIKVENLNKNIITDSEKLLLKLKQDGEIILYGVYFNKGKNSLKAESKSTLKNISNFLKEQPNLIVEIQGYTDDIGSSEANLILSENRAKSVKDALINLGVNPKKIKSKGYGEKSPIASNQTEAGRAHNRRIVLKLLKDGEISTLDKKEIIKK